MEKHKRKLAAIVFTDIVGFSELSSVNQSKASQLLVDQRDNFRPIVDSFNGRWIKEIGDGLLLIFDTVTDAVNCSIELQHVSDKIDGLKIRIGIHQGEILLENDDVIGDDVNIAARIEPFSAAGGIAITNKVNDAIIRESQFETKFLGKPKLKGVTQNIELYCITSHGLEETKLSDISTKLEHHNQSTIKWNFFNISGSILSIIGVLFWLNVSFLKIGIASSNTVPSVSILIPDNLGDEIDSKWINFLTENIIIDIANIGNVIVTPLRSIINVNKENLDLDQIIDRLKSDYLLLSSVYVDGDNFNINSQLISAVKNQSIFGKKLNDNIKNITIVSEQIATEIIKNIGLKPDIEIAYKGKQERFNEAYKNNDFKKAYDIIKPADRTGVTITIKGDYGYNRTVGTLTDDFVELFNKELLPKIISAPKPIVGIDIEIHSSNEALPENSVFKNNLDMTVGVAKNMESFITNLNITNNINVYGVGDIFPRGLEKLFMTTQRQKFLDELQREDIDKHNSTELERTENRRITLTLVMLKEDKI